MKLASLFIALVLALLPGKGPVTGFSEEQEISIEDIFEVEEDEYILSSRREPKQEIVPSGISRAGIAPENTDSFFKVFETQSFESRWIVHCRLRR